MRKAAYHKDILNHLVEKKHHPDEILKKAPCDASRSKLVVIGSSTGGTDALNKILSELPKGLPPIVMVQHIPKNFSTSLVTRLNNNSELDVFEVTEKMILCSGCAYLACGSTHIFLDYEGGKYTAKAGDGVRISRHKPSVDILFRSANNVSGKNTLAIILTGMGDDGSIGMKELFDNGAYTIAQDEKSCVIFGMPRKAIEAGAIKEVVPLNRMAQKIIDFSNDKLLFEKKQIL